MLTVLACTHFPKFDSNRDVDDGRYDTAQSVDYSVCRKQGNESIDRIREVVAERDETQNKYDATTPEEPETAEQQTKCPAADDSYQGPFSAEIQPTFWNEQTN